MRDLKESEGRATRRSSRLFFVHLCVYKYSSIFY